MKTLADSTIDTAAQTLTCGECGIIFSVPANWVESRRRDHVTWYCPNGHPRAFLGETREQKRIRQLEEDAKWYRDRAESAASDRDQARRSLAATKGVLTRTKNRIAKGVCPCCQRSFADLGRHMAGQHPEYAAVQP